MRKDRILVYRCVVIYNIIMYDYVASIIFPYGGCAEGSLGAFNRNIICVTRTVERVSTVVGIWKVGPRPIG